MLDFFCHVIWVRAWRYANFDVFFSSSLLDENALLINTQNIIHRKLSDEQRMTDAPWITPESQISFAHSVTVIQQRKSNNRNKHASYHENESDCRKAIGESEMFWAYDLYDFLFLSCAFIMFTSLPMRHKMPNGNHLSRCLCTQFSFLFFFSFWNSFWNYIETHPTDRSK